METRLQLGNVLWKNVLRPRLFSKEAEAAHLFTIKALERLHQKNLLWILRALYRSPYYRQPTFVFGVMWGNPIGIPAGFVKQGEIGATLALAELGVGSIEWGTFPPRPQPGNNPRDLGLTERVWRFPVHRALVNWFGFNSVGAETGARRLGELHQRHRLTIPIAVSVGKNKDTPDERAVADYLLALKYFLPVLRVNDWVKVNISSPNTPGLRQIFNRLDEFLGELVEKAKLLASRNGYRYPHLVLKVPPDGLDAADLQRIVKVAASHGFVGIEATNTTTDDKIKREYGLLGSDGKPLPGGVSGEPLRELSTDTLRKIRRVAREQKIDLVGVGGISEGWHANEKREAGAKTVQVYTGLVFRGPILLHEILTTWR